MFFLRIGKGLQVLAAKGVHLPASPAIEGSFRKPLL